MSAFGLYMWGHVNAFVYDCTSKVLGLASFHTGIWVVFGWRAEFYSVDKYSDTKQRVGSHIRSCWLLWHQYKRGLNIGSTFSWRLELGHNSQISQNMQYVNDMCKCNACVWSCKRIDRIHWSLKQGSMWFPRALCEWIGPHVVKMEALLH
jgi:hypothetical protein